MHLRRQLSFVEYVADSVETDEVLVNVYHTLLLNVLPKQDLVRLRAQRSSDYTDHLEHAVQSESDILHSQHELVGGLQLRLVQFQQLGQYV